MGYGWSWVRIELWLLFGKDWVMVGVWYRMGYGWGWVRIALWLGLGKDWIMVRVRNELG